MGAPMSRHRLWLMRLLAAIGVPLLVLVGLELVLRLTGYGYPTDFFLPSRIEGKNYYVSNLKFGFRFFPPALARAPVPLRMAAEKPANLYRIFLLGESAAYGDPDPTYGVGRYLEILLRERFPGTKFEVVCVAVTAINSHTILPIAQECARHQGDLWIIYAGNNEMIGPFGAATVFGAKAPSLRVIRASLALKTTKIGQLIDALVRRLRPGSSPKSWGGMKMFMENRLAYDDPGRLRVYEHFAKNLDDILRVGSQHQVPVILSTMAVNLKDCAPFASLHGQNMTAAQQRDWEQAYRAGIALETTNSPNLGLTEYLKAAAIDREFADLLFRIGTCHLGLTNSVRARSDFESARDYDALAIRADTRISQIIKDAAARYAGKGVYFVDPIVMLSESSPAGIPGQELFYEHVHLNYAGNYLVARVFAEQILKLLPESIAAQNKGSWVPAQFCNRRLAVTVWDRYRMWEVVRGRLDQPPFTGQSNHDLIVKQHAAELDEIRALATTQTPEEAKAIYEQAIAVAPEDNLLHANFAQFLADGNMLAQAIAESKRVIELLPDMPGPYCYLGTLLVRAGRSSEAAGYFSQALALRSDFVQAQNELALILAHQQKTAKAEAYFRRALRTDPTYVDTYLNYGFLKQLQGDMDGAKALFQEAARLQPRGAADYFNQAVALLAQGRHSEAIGYLKTLLPYKPDFWQARYLLGLELAALGDLEGSQKEFTEVIRYRPDCADAHLNLSIVLAKQQKPDEALAALRKTLELDPANQLARQHIDTVQRQRPQQ